MKKWRGKNWPICLSLSFRYCGHWLGKRYALLIDLNRFLFSQAIRWKTHVGFYVNGFDFFLIPYTSHSSTESRRHAHKPLDLCECVCVLFSLQPLYKYIQMKRREKQKNTKAASRVLIACIFMFVKLFMECGGCVYARCCFFSHFFYS